MNCKLTVFLTHYKCNLFVLIDETKRWLTNIYSEYEINYLKKKLVFYYLPT